MKVNSVRCANNRIEAELVCIQGKKYRVGSLIENKKVSRPCNLETFEYLQPALEAKVWKIFNDFATHFLTV